MMTPEDLAIIASPLCFHEYEAANTNDLGSNLLAHKCGLQNGSHILQALMF